MSKHPISCSLLQQLHDDQSFSHDPFRAKFKVLFNKAKKMTSRELLQQTPDVIGAKLLITLTAFVPIELDILGHSCDVVRHRNLLKIAPGRHLLNVLISRDSANLFANLYS